MIGMKNCEQEQFGILIKFAVVHVQTAVKLINGNLTLEIEAALNFGFIYMIISILDVV